MTAEFKSELVNLLKSVLNNFNADCEVELEKEGEQWRVCIKTENSEVLLENNAEALKCLQHILRVILHRKFPTDKSHFLLDVNGSRKQREKAIKVKIPDIAIKEVLNEGKTMIITGLSGYERMIVHKMLGESKGITTNSVGEKNDRRLLIMPTSEFGATTMDEAIVVNINKL